MSVHDDTVYVRHILRAMEKARTYTENLSETQFRANSLVQDGVVRQLEIVGEASKKVSTVFRELHREVPWSHMARMRHVLIHHYWEVDLNIVWTTLTDDLPKLEPLLRALMDEYRLTVEKYEPVSLEDIGSLPFIGPFSWFFGREGRESSELVLGASALPSIRILGGEQPRTK